MDRVVQTHTGPVTLTWGDPFTHVVGAMVHGLRGRWTWVAMGDRDRLIDQHGVAPCWATSAVDAAYALTYGPLSLEQLERLSERPVFDLRQRQALDYQRSLAEGE